MAIQWNEETTVNLQLWNIAGKRYVCKALTHIGRPILGQDRTGNMCRVSIPERGGANVGVATSFQAYYRDAVGAFVVFDVTKESTLDSALRWKADLDSKVFLGDGSYIPAVLLANKVCLFFIYKLKER